MTITAALVLFSVIWFLLLFIALPLRLSTQGEYGKIVSGTPSSAPTNPQIKKIMIWVTVISIVLWIPICLLISSGLLTISDLDFYGRLDT